MIISARSYPRYRTLRHDMGKAIADFAMIQPHDRIAVGLSGGKDSCTLLILLAELRSRAPIPFDLHAITVDAGYPGFRTDLIHDFADSLGIPLYVATTDHYAIITSKRRPGSSFCSFCARLKRGTLYTIAKELHCNRLALGHHQDDFIETLLLNQFFVGSLKAMSPCMLADTGDITVIRPLVYIPEQQIQDFTTALDLSTIRCCCPVAAADQQRSRMKSLLDTLERDIPQVRNSLLTALSNVHPRHLLDSRLQIFSSAEKAEPDSALR